MTLDDAIIHAEEIAFENETKAKEYREDQERKCAIIPFATMDFTKEYSCINCAKEHRQLAEWLRELKRYKEQDKSQEEQISVENRLPDDRNTAPVIVNWHETSPEPWMGKEQEE